VAAKLTSGTPLEEKHNKQTQTMFFGLLKIQLLMFRRVRALLSKRQQYRFHVAVEALRLRFKSRLKV
jgi:hypothetical protein